MRSEENDNSDKELLIPKPKYPYSVFFIFSNEFCERFNYYGMRTILAIYLTQKLDYSDDDATVIFHLFSTLVYLFCIFGATLADSWWGKFNTIVWLSLVYVCGSFILTLGSMEACHLPPKELTFTGLVLIAMGSGGIKPCVAAFGGEQFQLPEQAKELATFFSLFYFSINAGSLLSTFFTPILRDISCMGMDSCFPLGFGLPVVLMTLSIILFLSGKYKTTPAQGNMFVKIVKCICNATSTKCKEKTTNPRSHWLEYAEPKYGKKLVMETKILLNVLVLYIPLPIFWALFDQQGSRWTFQATRMDGDLGWFTIKPDQMQVVNPLLILTFIPLFEFLLYPLLTIFGIRRPLQKMTLGGVLAGIAFLCSMFLETKIELTSPILPKAGYSQFRMYNAMDCTYNVSTLNGSATWFIIEPNGYFQDLTVPLENFSQEFTINLYSPTSNCDSYQGVGTLNSSTANSFLITGNRIEPEIFEFEENPEKSRDGKPIIRVLANVYSACLIEFGNNDGVQYSHYSNYTDRSDIPAGIYDILINEEKINSTIKLKHGGVYAVIIHENENSEYTISVSTVTEPNSINMLWLVPQYVILTTAEVMFSVTGLQFAYTQAPESMKSVIQGFWLFTVSIGDIIVSIVVGADFFDSQVHEFLLFACLMFVDMAIFALLGACYKPIPLEDIKLIEELKDEE